MDPGAVPCGVRNCAGPHGFRAVFPAAAAGITQSRNPARPAGNLAAVAAAALLAGSPFFVWDLAVRAADIEKFAYRRGAAWPFLAYSGLQTCGIGLLGAALQSSPIKGRTALSAAASAPLFAGILLRYKDIPPFVFYLVEAALGVKLLRFTAASGDD